MDHDEEMTSSEGSVLDVRTASSNTSLSVGQTTPEKRASPQVSVSELEDLYGENVAAKVWRVAASYLEKEPTLETYPEFVPASGEAAGKYVSKPAAFWTCGFFPASLYCILERSMRHPQTLPRPASVNLEAFHEQLLSLCRSWSAPLRVNATRTNTHDLGFIMRPLRMDWELTGNLESLQSYIGAARSLATRYNKGIGAIRSWDKTVSHSYEITDKEKNFLIIVDSMCNMDLLFYAAKHAADPELATVAATHAHTVLKTLVRPDFSTWHVANLDPQKTGGVVQSRFTHQGYADGSTWSRGQAWGILGFAQTYMWTGDETFLTAALRLADYFLARLAAALPVRSHPRVPLWDFDAPARGLDNVDSEGQPLRDASAGMIAANGLLLLHQALQGRRQHAARHDYLDAALRIAQDTLGYCLDRDDVARFGVDGGGKVRVAPGAWDAILKHSTANNNRDALMRYRDHGLVYADYYFLEFGNKLLRMGLA